MDICPLYVFGFTVSVGNKYDKDLNMAILNGDLEYRDIMAYYLVFQSSPCISSFLQERFRFGNGDSLSIVVNLMKNFVGGKLKR